MTQNNDLTRDEQRLALWEAIQAIKIGRLDDDKLILTNLHAAGFVVARADTVAAQAQPDQNFWPVDPRASRKELIHLVGQMNFRLTAMRQEINGLIKRHRALRESITPADAVYGLLAWLSGRDEVVTLGARHSAAIAADLANAYCEANGLHEFSDDYPHNLKYPLSSLAQEDRPEGREVVYRDGFHDGYVRGRAEGRDEARSEQPVSGADGLRDQGKPWSGWACQYPGKLPRLYGDKAIAELNHHPEEGDRLLFLAAQPQPSGNAGELERECADLARQLNQSNERNGLLREALQECSAELFAQCGDQKRAMLYVEHARAALATQASAPAGAAVRAFREYLSVHEVSGRMDGRAVDDMALDLARIALGFHAQASGQAMPDPEIVRLAWQGKDLHSEDQPEYIVCAELVRIAEAARAAGSE